MILLAVGAGLAPKARTTLALPAHLVAGCGVCVGGGAAAELAAGPTGQVPVVRGAAVTVLAGDVGQARTLPGGPVTLTPLLWRTMAAGSAQHIAGTLAAGASPGIAVVTPPAELALRPLRVVQAPQTPARLPVTGPRIARGNVAMALARSTPAPWQQGVSIVTGRTLLASGACVSGLALTHQLPAVPVQPTGGGKVAVTARTTRTRAWTALPPCTQLRVPIVTGGTLLAVCAAGVVPAALAGSSVGLTLLGVPVALAESAGGEPPVPPLALTALGAERP